MEDAFSEHVCVWQNKGLAFSLEVGVKSALFYFWPFCTEDTLTSNIVSDASFFFFSLQISHQVSFFILPYPCLKSHVASLTNECSGEIKICCCLFSLPSTKRKVVIDRSRSFVARFPFLFFFWGRVINREKRRDLVAAFPGYDYNF